MVGGGVGGEADAALRFEPVDGVDQADHRDLDEVVEGLAAVGELGGEEPRQVLVLAHELFPERRVPAPAVLIEYGVAVVPLATRA